MLNSSHWSYHCLVIMGPHPASTGSCGERHNERLAGNQAAASLFHHMVTREICIVHLVAFAVCLTDFQFVHGSFVL